MTYDLNGNITSNSKGYYDYDAENKLTHVEIGASGPLGALEADYVYDGSGRRTQKTVTTASTTLTIQYLSDGDHEIGEYDGTGTSAPLTARYIYGSSVDEIIAKVDVSGNFSYAHRDRLGSVIAVSNSSGAVNSANQYSYSPYGLAETASGAGNAGFAYRYTGRRIDPETGFYYYRARYYDPGMGRFLQTDPVGYEDQMNLYAYVFNDPLNAIDPTGTTCTTNDGVATCKVDDPGNMSNKEVEHVEEAYTKAVNHLLENPDQEITIEVGDESFTTTAGDVAEGLADAYVKQGDKTTSNASTANGTLTPQETESGRTEIYVHPPGIAQSQRRLSTTLIHEGLHTVPQEKVLQGTFNKDPDKFQKLHRHPYSSGAYKLY